MEIAITVQKIQTNEHLWRYGIKLYLVDIEGTKNGLICKILRSKWRSYNKWDEILLRKNYFENPACWCDMAKIATCVNMSTSVLVGQP